MYFKLDVLENRGWRLTTNLKDFKCERCSIEISGEMYFCPEEEIFVCLSCGKRGWMPSVCSMSDEHEHLKIVDVVTLIEEVQETLT